MGRNSSGVYSLPPGSVVSDGQTTSAGQHNNPILDLEGEANTARPVSAGGTGATDPVNARSNLGVPESAAALSATGHADSQAALDYVSIDPTFKSGSHAHLLQAALTLLTADRTLTAPDKSGTVALVSDVASSVNAMLTNYVRPASGTFVPGVKFATPADSVITYGSPRTGRWIKLGSLVFYGFRIQWRLTKNAIVTTQPLLLDLSNIASD
jgi:hypothetical protein